MNQPRSLDEARRLFPDLGITLYAQTPRGAVTLEILDGDKTFVWTGATEAEVWTMAFPATPVSSDPSPDTTPAQSVFD